MLSIFIFFFIWMASPAFGVTLRDERRFIRFSSGTGNELTDYGTPRTNALYDTELCGVLHIHAVSLMQRSKE